MKRLFFCLGLFAACVALSLFSYIRVERMQSEMTARIDYILAYIPEGGGEKLTPEQISELEDMVAELERFWLKEEDTVIHLVRRNYVDSVSIGVSKLSGLARHADAGGLSSELWAVRHLVRRIYLTEKLNIDNIM